MNFFSRRRARLLIAHPLKHHVFPLAAGAVAGVQDSLLLVPLNSRCSVAKIVSVFGGGYSTRISGYWAEELPVENVHSPFIFQIIRLLSLLLGEAWIVKIFDIYVAGLLRGGLLKPEILVTLQDYMPCTVRTASGLGIRIWSDQILNNSVEARLSVFSSSGANANKEKIALAESLNDEVLKVSTVVTVPSCYTLEGVKNRLAPTVPVHIVPYGHGIDALPRVRLLNNAYDQAKPRLIVVRAHSLRKGGHLVMDALIRLCKYRPNKSGSGAHFCFLGAILPELQLNYEALVDACVGSDFTVSSGPVPNKSVPDLLRQADAFLMPSLSESMSLACIESLACGTPLIVSRQCGIDGFESAGCGFIIEPNSDEILYAVERVIAGDLDDDNISRQCIEFASRLTWSAYRQRIANLSLSLLNSKN